MKLMPVHTLIKSSFITLFFVMITLCQCLKAQDELMLDASNTAIVEENLITAGQPSSADFERLNTFGVSHVINLRTQGEHTKFDAEKLSEKLGLSYMVLPIAGSAGINKENALKLDQLLNQSKGKVFLHCGSSNRVGALLALREFYVKGKSAEAALKYGKEAGLSSLKGHVKSILKNSQK